MVTFGLANIENERIRSRKSTRNPRQLYGSPKVTEKLHQQGVTISGRLAVLGELMDLYSRKIVGWYTRDHITKELVLQALRQDYGRQRPDGAVLHHSDRGNQYVAHEYQELLQVYFMTGSMARKGNDNACIESFHSIIKKELIYLNKYATPCGGSAKHFRVH
ncbi:DDE-type integrase/transposase/recombinase [Paenibacillus athensensis]|nr:DDE-type integrase/transposase/recombinase [Paenibacillus athensensis]MCD1257665.1 DDE-type integrase/transposase/recombinase [Paenibacillus athensensis]